MKMRAGSILPKAATTLWVMLLSFSLVFGQDVAGPPPVSPDAQQQQQGAPLLSPAQLENLVAPIALYPDPLLGQVLAASTYPLEIAEAQRWVQRNRNLQGAQLMDAAKQQNWDPSVQALVALPDALNLLGNDLRWTTDLGNAFLAQQADVMSAIQRMRGRARQNGRLANTPQQVVTTDTQDGQSAIQIQPADPQVVYVPVYNPAYVWGPPAWDAYPDLWYPSGFGFGFGPGIYIGSFFPGWFGWGGWGWGCGWFGHGLFINSGFFGRYGFRGGHYGGGRAAWAHDAGHRMGVPYSNRTVASQFNRGGMNGSRGQFNGNRSSGSQASAGGWQRFNGASRASNGYSGSYRQQASPNYGSRAGSSYRSAPSSGRSFAPAHAAPRAQGYSAPRSYSAPRQSYSSPRSFSAPHSSGGRSSYSGGHSGSTGGHSGGGGHSSGGSGHHR